MPIIATDKLRFSNTVKHEYEPALAFTRATVVINDVANSLVIGAVLGKVTATGKYKLVEATAADGSQNAAAVLIADTTVPATTDTSALVIIRGPAIVSKTALSFGSTVNTAPELAAAYAQLEALGILVNDAV